MHKCAFLLLAGLLLARLAAAAEPAPRAVATFESLGVYWAPGADPGAGGCELRYRKAGEKDWRNALPMWFDARNRECRGSIVQLAPGSAYELELKTQDGRAAQLKAQTW